MPSASDPCGGVHSQGALSLSKGNPLPDLSFVLPPASENRWTDLLATLVATDPQPLKDLLDVEFDTIHREVVASTGTQKRSDRLDILLELAGRPVVAIEAKLLANLSPGQLDRYQSAWPSARQYRVLHLQRLPVHPDASGPWSPLTWEAVLSAYTDSTHLWVRHTATAWLATIGATIPAVSSTTVWNDVPDDAAGLEVALRARVAWLAGRLDLWCDLDHDMIQASGGGNWAVRVWRPTTAPDHYATVELQEGLTAYEWKPNPDRPYRDRLPGPVILLGLRQQPVDTSAKFDWTLLHQLFARHILDPSGNPRDTRAWHTTPARPTHPIDKQNWQNMVDAGAPRWLGKGWGMKVAQRTGACLFGARFGLSPTTTLGEIDRELQRIVTALTDMNSDTP